MSTFPPAARLDLAAHAAKQCAAMYALERSINLDRTVRGLIKLRASQVNGCAFCIDMHWKDARAAGEPEERLYLLDSWRDSTLYSPRERAALQLCEAVTRVADTHVPDDVWEAAGSRFESDELAELLFAITAINAWNRLCIAVRAEAGTYQSSLPEAA
jgi:AhpD family alkylhydroperoxidase